jgi:hypothetical protein
MMQNDKIISNELQMQKEIVACLYIYLGDREAMNRCHPCVKSQTNGAPGIFWGGGGAADLEAIKNFI